MGTFSKKTKTTSNETVAPSTFAQPYISDAASTLKPAFDRSMSFIDRYTPQIDQGIGYYGDTLAGKFMGGNPWQDKVLHSINQDTADAVNAQFIGAGRYGSDYHARTLADRIAENENRVRYGDYATERGYQNDAAMRQADLIGNAVDLPQRAAGNYAGNVGGLVGRYVNSNGTSVTKSSPGLASILGGGMSLLARYI